MRIRTASGTDFIHLKDRTIMEKDLMPSKELIQDELSEKMLALFESVTMEREEYYSQNPHKIPKKSEIKGIISSCGNKNALISGAVSLIPGPLGMAASVPEIALIIRNQIRMIYDIGVAQGKSDRLTRELLAGIFASALGTGSLGLFSDKESKIVINAASWQMFQKIMVFLAGRVTQQMLKSMTSKWLPIVGAVTMTVWSKYSTAQAGKKAVELLSKDIYIIDGKDFQDIEIEIEPDIDDKLLTKLKIVSLSNIMKVDKKILKVELDFIETLISNSDLDEATLDELRSELQSPELCEVDHSVFPDGHIDTIGLMLDLVSLAKRDGEFHSSEKKYIKQVGKIVGFNKDQISAFLDL
ncbi:MAG: TerB family tellurite resistance protein [Proteobacteria bacterium]|nr:TerB family tellurite resistance protein [Pseudomonadota bacterium]